MTPILYQILSSTHVGDGASVGNISLPLVRERHTGWPWLPGSSLKGALRARARFLAPRGEAEAEKTYQHRIERFFGPEAETEVATGSFVVTGAQLWALPVRSIKGTFLLLTCPLALARLRRLFPELPPSPSVDQGSVLLADGNDAFLSEATGLKLPNKSSEIQGMVVIEDVAFPGSKSRELDQIVACLNKMFVETAPFEKLAMVSDDSFTRACALWTEVRTHASIDKDGVVVDGQLYNIESLPPETLLVGEIAGDDPKLGLKDKEEAINLFPANQESWVVGGHKSTGLGRVAWYGRKP